MLKRKFFDEDENNNEDDLDIYAKQNRDLLLEDDEINGMEEAFMNGYEDITY